MNSLNSTDIEKKRKNFEMALKVVAIGVIGFMVSPFIFVAIHGIVGMAIAAGIGVTAVNIAPAFIAMAANWRIKALKAVAAANPIETLENVYAQKQKALSDMRDNIQQSHACLIDLYNQIQEHDQAYPGKPSQWLDKYTKMKQLVEMRGRKYKQAQVALAQFNDQIAEKRSDWKIAQTMLKAGQLANVGQDFQSKLMQDTALTTVQGALDLAFADLETSLLDAQPDTGTAPAIAQAPARGQLPAPGPMDLGFEPNNVIDAEIIPARRAKG